MQEFGERLDGKVYRPRPGSYAVADDGDRIAVVRTKKGLYLPGGGREPGESALETLVREVLEECGCAVRVLATLGRAIEYVTTSDGRHVQKLCSFFHVRLGPVIARASEPDHELLWLPTAKALDQLSLRSQARAVLQLHEELARTG